MRPLLLALLVVGAGAVGAAPQDTRRQSRPWVLTAYVVCVTPVTEDTGLPGNTLTVQ
jgi:hypothetical protein